MVGFDNRKQGEAPPQEQIKQEQTNDLGSPRYDKSLAELSLKPEPVQEQTLQEKADTEINKIDPDKAFEDFITSSDPNVGRELVKQLSSLIRQEQDPDIRSVIIEKLDILASGITIDNHGEGQTDLVDIRGPAMDALEEAGVDTRDLRRNAPYLALANVV